MNTMDLLPAIIALGSMGGLLYLGIRNLQKDQSRQEVHYWQRECIELEYENQFLHELSNRLVPRLVSRLGAPFQDYLIEREILGQLPAEPNEPNEMRQPMQVFFGGSGKGIDITASNFAAETWDDEVDEYEARYEVNDDADTAYSEPPPIRPCARPQRHRRTTRPFPSPTPAFAYNAHWQSPIRSNRLISPTMFRQPENDDVIEAEYTEVLPSLLNHSQRQPETPKPPSTRKGGRPKKYASAAERQAAYRARMAA